GFWRVLDETSLPLFLYQGWYGAGSDRRQGIANLESQLHPLLHDAQLRRRLGTFSLTVLTQRYSLEAAATRQLQFYRDVLEQDKSRKRLTAAHAVAAAGFAKFKISRLAARLRGTVAADDFNAQASLRSDADAAQPPVGA